VGTRSRWKRQFDFPILQAPPLATVDESEAMYEHCREAFSIHGFLGSHAIERNLMGLRRICERAGLERRDVRLLRGIARQLPWALHHPRHPGDNAS
jgi:tRNA C32,U32 (ribose-2'-O)-methylase TrmJ